ncbi:MAG: hypothetical protein JWL78_426 [Chloroflexi bacterium]|jgi:hypothetical protein|nr:hypothetical protein [Chloroflexota bacterium]MEA2618720.1 hypothetical protein [Chloroflexota bacterium]
MMMNLRRLLACGLAAASLAGGVGSTVLVGHAASRTAPPVKQKVHKQHCVKPVAGQPPTANTCKPMPKPKPKTHTLKPKPTTHSPKPKPQPVHTLPAPGH